MRIHELAKELSLTSKALLAVCSKLKIEAASHASALTDKDVAKVKSYLEEIANPKQKSEKIHKSIEPIVEEVFEVVQPEAIPEEPKKKVKEEESAQDIQVVEVISDELTVKSFAELIKIPLTQIMTDLIKKGLMLHLNQDIEFELAAEIAQQYNILLEKKDNSQNTEQQKRLDDVFLAEIEEDDRFLKERPPVITVMGHVDHGKTRLLDAIRKTNVVDSEAGGITQHIGAYQVKIKKRDITFIDTPGHEAFTQIRARGANLTDIVILVVAADDGVMPQTVEAIHHAKAAGVPIIVAVNKIDKPEANPDRVKQQLSEHDLVPEEWGGKTIFVSISAKQGLGIEDLLEMVLLVADTEELKANPHKKAIGIILESNLSKSQGPIATVLIKSGTLRVGNPFVIGPVHGKVRAILDDKGRKIKEAGPSSPVMIMGLSDVPSAGDVMQVVTSEKEAKTIAGGRASEMLELKRQKRKAVTLDEYSKKINQGDITNLNIVLKADVQGSLEAILSSIEKINVAETSIQVVHSGTGMITESDLMLANASDAIIMAFNVAVPVDIKNKADEDGVVIKLYAIIYKLLEDLTDTLKGLLKPIYERVLSGTAEVRTIFKFSKVGVIAGCFVLDGKITRNAELEIYRGNNMVFEGKLDSLKRFKDDVKEVSTGFECGIVLEGFNDFEEGDLIKVFSLKEVKR